MATPPVDKVKKEVKHEMKMDESGVDQEDIPLVRKRNVRLVRWTASKILGVVK